MLTKKQTKVSFVRINGIRYAQNRPADTKGHRQRLKMPRNDPE